MRLPRFYVDQAIADGLVLELPVGAAQHAVRVLRLGVGDDLVLFNGDGRDYPARIVLSTRQKTTVQVVGSAPNRCQARLPITLIQAIARGERMDLILQKATELGVYSIIPVASDRSEVRLEGERAKRRMDHWRQVIASACEQCGCSRLPPISAPRPLAQALTELGPAGTGEWRFCLHPEAGRNLAAISDPDALVIAVGPEGGFSERDLALFDAAGFQRLRLGSRVLRTETAGPAAIAAVQARFGDFV